MREHKDHNNPNQGLNTKVYLTAIIIGALIILAALFFFVAARGKKDIPKVNQPNPNSRLVVSLPVASLA